MKFQSQTTRLIQEAEENLKKLHEQLTKEKQEFIARKIGEGWKKFTFTSSYEGGSKYGGNFGATFLFAPGVDIAQWQKVVFIHSDESLDENALKCFDSESEDHREDGMRFYEWASKQEHVEMDRWSDD